MKIKLIRDNIPEIIRQSGRNPRVMTIHEYVDQCKLIDGYKLIKHDFFKAKFDEELLEFKNAQSELDKIEELADILEVIEVYFEPKIVELILGRAYPTTEESVMAYNLILYNCTNFDAILSAKHKKNQKNGSFLQEYLLFYE